MFYTYLTINVCGDVCWISLGERSGGLNESEQMVIFLACFGVLIGYDPLYTLSLMSIHRTQTCNCNWTNKLKLPQLFPYFPSEPNCRMDSDASFQSKAQFGAIHHQITSRDPLLIVTPPTGRKTRWHDIATDYSGVQNNLLRLPSMNNNEPINLY